MNKNLRHARSLLFCTLLPGSMLAIPTTPSKQEKSPIRPSQSLPVSQAEQKAVYYQRAYRYPLRREAAQHIHHQADLNQVSPQHYPLNPEIIHCAIETAIYSDTALHLYATMYINKDRSNLNAIIHRLIKITIEQNQGTPETLVQFYQSINQQVFQATGKPISDIIFYDIVKQTCKKFFEQTIKKIIVATLEQRDEALERYYAQQKNKQSIATSTDQLAAGVMASHSGRQAPSASDLYSYLNALVFEATSMNIDDTLFNNAVSIAHLNNYN